MTKDYAIIVRNNLTNLGLKDFNMGHTGITMVNSEGTETHFDFGSPLASEKYRRISSTFATASSYASYFGVGSMYAAMGFIAAQTETDSVFAMTIASYIATTYSFLLTPMKGVLIESDNIDDREPAENIRINIDQDTYNSVLNNLRNKDPGFYTAGIFNCAGFARNVLRKAGVEIPRRIFNTPNILQRDLASYDTPIVAP